jgi:hypothetical protein
MIDMKKILFVSMLLLSIGSKAQITLDTTLTPFHIKSVLQKRNGIFKIR